MGIAPPVDHGAHGFGDVTEGVDHVGREDVGIADVDDPTLRHLGLEVPPPRRQRSDTTIAFTHVLSRLAWIAFSVSSIPKVCVTRSSNG